MAVAELEQRTVTFHSESDEVLADVRRAFGTVLATLGVRRPIELQRLLKLDSKMSWQICKVAGLSGRTASIPSVPSRASVTRFVNGVSAAGVPARQVQSLNTAYNRFEQLVERHAGDRTSFNSLVASPTELSKEWLATDLQHRRNMFRGESHVMGVHARTRLVAGIFERDSGGGHRFLSLTGYVGLRVLRAMDLIRVHGCSTHNNNHDAYSQISQHRSLTAGSKDSFLLETFCSQPVSNMQVSHGGPIDNSWVRTYLVRPDIGNMGLTTVMFGESYLFKQPVETNSALVTIPLEVLMIDVLAAPGLFCDAPSLSVFREGDMVVADSPPPTILLGDYKVQSLGRGTSDLATADVPNYPDLIHAAALDLQGDIETFDVWRVRLEFPVYHTNYCLNLSYAGC